jgi:hypothetical protein
MPASFGSTTYTPDALIAGDADDLVSRKVTLISGQNLTRGAVLGKITASGKYTLALSASADGSQTPDAVLAQDCDASAGDAEAMIYISGTFIQEKLTIGAGLTTAGIRDGLQDKRGIILVSSVGA